MASEGSDPQDLGPTAPEREDDAVVRGAGLADQPDRAPIRVATRLSANP
jgi:hypothetical protein